MMELGSCSMLRGCIRSTHRYVSLGALKPVVVVEPQFVGAKRLRNNTLELFWFKGM
jgi:hypothetical protein